MRCHASNFSIAGALQLGIEEAAFIKHREDDRALEDTSWLRERTDHHIEKNVLKSGALVDVYTGWPL